MKKSQPNIEENYLSREEFEEYLNKIVIARQIVKIPTKDRDLVQRKTLETTLKELNSKYMYIFYTMNNFISSRLGAIIHDDEYEFVREYQSYIDNNAFVPPKISRSASEKELKEALSSIYKDQVTIKGALAVITPLCREVNLLMQKAESSVKGVMFMEDNQWGADSVFNMMFPQSLWEKYSQLEALKVAYELKEEQFDSAFEVISRLVTIELTMPTDEPRRRRYEPEDSDDSTESEVKPKQTSRKLKKPGRWSEKL